MMINFSDFKYRSNILKFLFNCYKNLILSINPPCIKKFQILVSGLGTANPGRRRLSLSGNLSCKHDDLHTAVQCMRDDQWPDTVELIISSPQKVIEMRPERLKDSKRSIRRSRRSEISTFMIT